MTNPEINGIRVLVEGAVERGTIHIMRMPPKREDYLSDEEHALAYHEWWDTMHLWSCTIKNVGDA